MLEKKSQQGRNFLGFLMGSFLGALAGIFFAPKSGKELRSDVTDKGRKVLMDAKEIYTDAGTKAKGIIEEAKHRTGGFKKEAGQYLSAAYRKGKEIFTAGKKNKEVEASEPANDVMGGEGC
jgi:gas vesicle protein